MNKEDVIKWIKDFWVFLLAFLGELGLFFTRLSEWLISVSPLMDALVKFFMACILGVYFLKVFFGLKVPVFSPLFDKIKKSVGKDKKMVTISIAESDGEDIEVKMTRMKIILKLMYVTLKKGRKIMGKMFKAIGKAMKWVFVYNRWTMLGLLAILLAVGSMYVRFTSAVLPETWIISFYFRAVQSMSNEAFWSGISTLVGYAWFVCTQRGFETEATYLARKTDIVAFKEEEKKNRDATRELIKHNALINKAVKPVYREIEDVIIKGLLQRIENAKIYGIQPTYIALNKGIKELSYEYISVLLGEEAFNVLLEELDVVAEELELFSVVNGKKVNAIVEELKK